MMEFLKKKFWKKNFFLQKKNFLRKIFFVTKKFETGGGGRKEMGMECQREKSYLKGFLLYGNCLFQVVGHSVAGGFLETAARGARSCCGQFVFFESPMTDDEDRRGNFEGLWNDGTHSKPQLEYQVRNLYWTELSSGPHVTW